MTVCKIQAQKMLLLNWYLFDLQTTCHIRRSLLFHDLYLYFVVIQIQVGND